MQIVLVLLFIVLGGMPAGERKCSCSKADDNDRAHGANAVVEYEGKTLRTISGKISLPNDEAVSNGVVEIYEINTVDQIKSAYELAGTQDRILACLADKQGRFCISDLPSGRYLLKVGTREPSGLNEVFIKVRLERSWWKRWFRSGKALDIVLPLGF